MCGGIGRISDEQINWINCGRAYRQTRMAVKETASQAATRLGISIQTLTDAELGRISPAVLVGAPLREAADA